MWTGQKGFTRMDSESESELSATSLLLSVNEP